MTPAAPTTMNGITFIKDYTDLADDGSFPTSPSAVLRLCVKLFSEEFTCVAHTTMNENIYPQIPQIVQIIFSFSLRPPRSLRFIYEGDKQRK